MGVGTSLVLIVRPLFFCFQHNLLHRYLGGTIHKEIFELERVLKGPYKGREWERIVKKVIDEWGEFVKMYV